MFTGRKKELKKITIPPLETLLKATGEQALRSLSSGFQGVLNHDKKEPSGAETRTGRLFIFHLLDDTEPLYAVPLYSSLTQSRYSARYRLQALPEPSGC